MKDKKIFKAVLSTYSFIGLQLVVSMLLCYYVIKLNMLPTKYLLAFFVVILILLLIAFFIQFKAKTNSIRAIISRIVCVLLSIGLGFISLEVNQGNTFLNKITDSGYQIQQIDVIVLNDSKVKDITDLNNKKLTYISMIDQENMKQALEDITHNIPKASMETVEDIESLGNALYGSTADAIVINDSYVSFLEEIYPNFDEETEIIYTYQIKEAVKETVTTSNDLNGVYNIFLSGIDTRGAISTVSRSDVNLILTVNTNTRQILMTSMPRDSYVPLAMNGKLDKLTHSGIYGINETISTVENFVNTELDYYGRVNFSSVVSIVDALGGIEITSDQDITLDGFTYHKGKNSVNGAQALRFARERYSYQTGDLHRNENQQMVLEGIINKCMSKDILTRYASILTSMEDFFQTNLDASKIGSIVKGQLEDMSTPWTIHHQYITGVGKKTYGCYSMPNSNLYVNVPNQASVDTCSKNIQLVIDGQVPIVEKVEIN